MFEDEPWSKYLKFCMFLFGKLWQFVEEWWFYSFATSRQQYYEYFTIWFSSPSLELQRAYRRMIWSEVSKVNAFDLDPNATLICHVLELWNVKSDCLLKLLHSSKDFFQIFTLGFSKIVLYRFKFVNWTKVCCIQPEYARYFSDTVNPGIFSCRICQEDNLAFFLCWLCCWQHMDWFEPWFV